MDFSPIVLGLAQEGNHDPLNEQFVGGNEIRVLWVFRVKEGTPVAHKIALQRRLAVDEGGNDVAVVGVPQLEDN